MVELSSTLRLVGPVLRTFVQYSVAFYARPLAAGDVILSGTFVGQIVLDKRVKFRDRCLNGSGEIPPEADGSGIFDTCVAITSDGKYIMTSFYHEFYINSELEYKTG